MRTTVICLAALAATAIGCDEPTPCSTNEECAAAEVCTANGCADAFGVEYDLIAARAEGISDYRPPPEGGLWDPGAAPDPYLVLTAGDWTCQTFHDSDSLAPTWDDITNCTPLVIDAATRFGWSMWDDDGDVDPAELIAEVPAGEEFAVTAEDLHGGTVTSAVGDVTVELDFTPTILLAL